MGNLGEFEQLILFVVLRLGDKACGISIREDIEERTGRVISSGAIYTALGRMEERELVNSWVGQPTSGKAGRPRKYYTLEPKGARTLRDSYSMVQAMAGGLVRKLTVLAEE